jgi:hypothetical protein
MKRKEEKKILPASVADPGFGAFLCIFDLWISDEKNPDPGFIYLSLFIGTRRFIYMTSMIS